MKVLALLFLLFAIFDFSNAQRRFTRQLGSFPLDVSIQERFECQASGKSDKCFQIKIEAPKKPPCDPRVSITAVIDRSSSMKGEPFSILKSSIDHLVKDHMDSQDFAGIISFSSAVDANRVPLLPVTTSHEETVENFVDGLVVSGKTNLEAALLEGLDQQSGTSRRIGRYVVLFTDGEATAGERNGDQIASRLDPSGPVVFTLGFGDDPKADFLEPIATAGRGLFDTIQSEEEIPDVFGSIIGLLNSVTHRSIRVSLSPRNGATIASVEGGIVTRSSSGSWRVFYPDLAAEETREILVCLKFPKTSISTKEELVSVRVSSSSGCSGIGTGRTSGSVYGQRSCSAGLIPRANPRVEVTRLRKRAADDIDKALKLKESGDTAGAVSILESLLDDLKSSTASSRPIIQSIFRRVEKILEDFKEEKVLSNPKKLKIKSDTASLKNQRGLGSSSIVPLTRFQQEGAVQLRDAVLRGSPP